jgi:crotonobetaine/carnitine-CoA ligase
MRDAVARTAGLLFRWGVCAGDRVAALVGNRVELLDLILGCGWLGAIVVPLNTALRGASLRHALGSAQPTVLVIESDLLPVLSTSMDVQQPPPLRVLQPGAGLPGIETAEPITAAELDGADTAAILFTSGTTGASKGVCCPHEQFVWWGRNVTNALRITPDDVLFTSLPLFHTNAINAFAQALVAGSGYALWPRFSASRFWGQAAACGGTVGYLLGAMVTMLYVQPEAEADHAHRMSRALAPATPASLCAPFQQRFGVMLIDGFGTTETNLVIGAPPEEARPGYLGMVRDGFFARVLGGDGSPVAAGTPGELVVRSEHRNAFASGYWRLPEATVAVWRGGWLHTGDRVVRDEDGWFRFVDRMEDVIRRRGENISSYEVERAMLGHPGIAAVAVFAVPSELGEDEVMASVVPTSGWTVEPAELVRHCSGELPYFAVPRYIEIVVELPVTETGKVRKRELRQRGVTPATWNQQGR